MFGSMENLIILLATSFMWRLSPKRSKNHSVGHTGCSALLFSDKGFEHATTQAGDRLYFHEHEEKKVVYGIICVHLREACERHEALEMLSNYMQKLRDSFCILHHLGHQLEEDWNSLRSRSLVDYWQDGHSRDWKVKGYTDGRTMAVLYVKNITAASVMRQDLFLNSFYFKAGQ